MQEKVRLGDIPISIRPYEPGDVIHHFEAVVESIDQLIKWFTWCHRNYSLEESRRFIEDCRKRWESGTHDFAIMDCQLDSFLGNCSLQIVNTSEKIATMNYWVRSSRRGEGAATAAARLLVKFGFEQLKLKEIQILVAVCNKESRRVAEKIGAALTEVNVPVPAKNRIYDGVRYTIAAETYVTHKR